MFKFVSKRLPSFICAYLYTLKTHIMKKHCLECNDAFSGRSDKKFCSDDCRSRHYHKKKGDQISRIRGINYILKRNRLILEKFTHKGKRKVRRSLLLEQGFSFEFFTHVRESNSGSKFKYCYDQGYCVKPDDSIFLRVERKRS